MLGKTNLNATKEAFDNLISKGVSALWGTLYCKFSLAKTTHSKLVEPDELVKHVKPDENVNNI